MTPENAAPRDLRNFGFGMTLFCGVIGGLIWWKGHAPSAYGLWSAAFLVFLAPALLMPARLRPVFRVWMKIAGVMSWIISNTMLCAIFYLVFTAVSLIQKLIGRDLLALKFPGNQDSYWIDRSQEPDNPKHFERLY